MNIEIKMQNFFLHKFKRPAKSNFTRVQRLTCCLSLLFCTMCTSIAFYQSDESSSPKEYGVGPVTFTLTGLYIGIVSGLMSLEVKGSMSNAEHE
jgi:hypothetical protein